MSSLKSLIGFIVLLLSIQGLPRSSWAMKWDTKSSQNIHKSDYFHRFYDQDRLTYLGFQYEGINQLNDCSPNNNFISRKFAHFPNWLLSCGGGYRHSISSDRSIGFSCFHDISVNMAKLRLMGFIKPEMAPEEMQNIFEKNNLYGTAFSNIKLGFELGLGSLHVDCNFYIPGLAPFLSEKQYYLKHRNMSPRMHNALKKLGLNDAEVHIRDIMREYSNCFETKGHEHFEKAYHPEEGSWGTEIKATYNIDNYTGSFAAPYCFYDSYGHFIPGMSIGIHHIKFPWDAEFKYSVDAPRGHYVTTRLEYLFNRNWGVRNWGVYCKTIYNLEHLAFKKQNYQINFGLLMPLFNNPRSSKRDLYTHPLWQHPVNSHAAPFLVPSRNSRSVQNNLFFFRKSNVGHWTGASFENPNGFLNQSAIDRMPPNAKIYIDGEATYDLGDSITLKKGQSLWGCLESYQSCPQKSQEKPELIGRILFNRGTSNNSLNHLKLNLPKHISLRPFSEDSFLNFSQAKDISLNNVDFNVPISLKNNTPFSVISARDSILSLEKVSLAFRNKNSHSTNCTISTLSVEGNSHISIANSKFLLSTASLKDDLYFSVLPSHQTTHIQYFKNNIIYLEARNHTQFVPNPSLNMDPTNYIYRITSEKGNKWNQWNQSNFPNNSHAESSRRDGSTSQQEAYSFLKVSQDASWSTISKAYKTMSLKCHPDKGGSDEAMSKLNRHYEELKTLHGK